MFGCYGVIVFEGRFSVQNLVKSMGSITDFEELACWQKARELVNAVYKVTNNRAFKQDFKLRDQLLVRLCRRCRISPRDLRDFIRKTVSDSWTLHKARQPK